MMLYLLIVPRCICGLVNNNLVKRYCNMLFFKNSCYFKPDHTFSIFNSE